MSRTKRGESASRGEREQIALLGRLDANEVHGRSLHRLGIAVIVLVGLDERLDVLRREQGDVMPKWPNLARDMMRARAGLQADEAGWQIDKPAHKLLTRYLVAHRDGAGLVETDQVERILADLEADGSDRVG
jgi:hypothetical protein